MATVARRCEGVGAGARRSQVIFLPASGILPPDSSGFVISPFLQNTVNCYRTKIYVRRCSITESQSAIQRRSWSTGHRNQRRRNPSGFYAGGLSASLYATDVQLSGKIQTRPPGRNRIKRNPCRQSHCLMAA